MGPSHIFENPIEVLLDGMIKLLEGANEHEFIWNDEPGEYKWSIKRNHEQKHKIFVSITGCIQINAIGKPEVETLNFEVKLKLFSICILRQMEKIRDLMKDNSFKENREGEFPYKTFKEYKSVHERAFS